MDCALTPWEHAKALLPFSDLAPEALVYDRIITNQAALWVSPRSAAVTEVTDSGALHIWLAGGVLDELLGMLAGAETLAGVLGCHSLELSGRRGWRKVLPPYGFALVGEKMVKKL